MSISSVITGKKSEAEARNGGSLLYVFLIFVIKIEEYLKYQCK